jgi:hypothetical protein
MPDRPRFDQLVRLGYVVRGLVFVALGAVAWFSGRGESTVGILGRVRDLPAGPALLLIIAAGLGALAVFRLAEAWLDLDYRGSDGRGKMRRIGRAVGGLGYGALALAALAAALGVIEAGTLDKGGTAAREVADAPGIGVGLVLAGLATIGAGVAQFANAATARFMRELRGDAPGGICWMGRAGYAARGVIFVMGGWFALRAGLGGTKLRGAAEVLEELSDHRLLFGAVALGLVLFGLFSLIESRFRRLPDEGDLKERAKQELA